MLKSELWERVVTRRALALFGALANASRLLVHDPQLAFEGLGGEQAQQAWKNSENVCPTLFFES